MRWTAIALIKPHWHSIPIDGKARNITSDVSYEPVPQWLESLADDDLAREELGEHAQAVGAYCLMTHYCAAPPGSGQTEPVLPVEPSPHDRARRALQTATLMLWLVRRSSFGFDKTVLANEDEHGWVWREVVSHDVVSPLPSYEEADIRPDDFPTAAQFAQVFANAKADGTVRMASHSLGMALRQTDWPLRYLALWLSLEGLFGPDDARETTFRLCQRIALFLEPRGPKAVELFKTVSELYRWRSKVVHGMRLQKLDPYKSLDLIEELETLVHRSISRILSEPDLLQKFDSAAREQYLDHLPLT